jgi:hypothetical protein
MAASGERPSPRSEYAIDEARASLDALVERDEAWAEIEVWIKKSDAAEAEVQRLREALEAIASCESRFPGDVVSIARAALGEEGT